MDASSIPAKFPEPFAVDATSSYIRTIPTTSSDPTAASLQLGFPPDTFLPEASGGTPPDGRDFNGILNQITAWCQWLSSGGPVAYDGTYSSAIGGYPAGAWLEAATGPGNWWVSLVDNNTSDPDTGGANWLAVSFGQAGSGSPKGAVAGNAPVNGSVAQSLYYDKTGGTGLWICTTTGTAMTAVWAQVGGQSGAAYWNGGTTTGSANSQTVTPPATVQSLSSGALISATFGFTNSTAANLIIGSFGSFPIRKEGPSGPIALGGGEMRASNSGLFLFDGSFAHLLTPAMGTAAQSNATNPSTGNVVSAYGSFTPGHVLVAQDSSGTAEDGGAIITFTGPSGANHLAGYSNTTGNLVNGPAVSSGSLSGTVAAVSGSFTSGHSVTAADSNGTIQDSGYPVVTAATGTTVLLNTLTASNSAYLADTTSLTSAYSYYEIVFENLVLPFNASPNSLEIQLYESSGLLTGTSYAGVVLGLTASSTVSASNGSSSGLLIASLSGNVVINGVLVVQAPSASGVLKHFAGNFVSDGGYGMFLSNLVWNGDSNPITGFKVFTSLTNISSGSIKIYGRA